MEERLHRLNELKCWAIEQFTTPNNYFIDNIVAEIDREYPLGLYSGKYTRTEVFIPHDITTSKPVFHYLIVREAQKRFAVSSTTAHDYARFVYNGIEHLILQRIKESYDTKYGAKQNVRR
jgi:hypothetical protein